MTFELPQRLLATAPGWEIRADVIVVGSGIAGLATAIHARRTGHRVLIVTKGFVDEGSTRWAQGGIAAALADDDSPAEHQQDTLVAGVGLCDTAAVRVLAYEGPSAVRRLVRWGADFDRDANGGLSLTREGGHHRNRIAHAGGDATGLEISRALVAAVSSDPGIEIIEHALCLDLLKDERGHTQGLTLHVMGEGQHDGIGAALASVVVLATGGIGQVFASSTNPAVATGDGVALGVRAGAAVADLEFVQFHPTVLWLGTEQVGQQPLISEALRGEGAQILDPARLPLMTGVHPMGDLAPRDVVAKRITHSMREFGAQHVWLDATGFDSDLWNVRFPNILAACQSHGIDPRVELIPIVPAQHYVSGGLLTDLNGRTTVPGLFAIGECACTGVHGANRLASNSLLEGLVFADRIGTLLAGGVPDLAEPLEPTGSTVLLSAHERATIQRAMTDKVGVLRTEESITAAISSFAGLSETRDSHTGAWETSNIATVATLIAHAARERTETRGSHWRDDYPDRDDQQWLVRLVGIREEDGSVSFTRRNVG